jgi:hypothetical protein
LKTAAEINFSLDTKEETREETREEADVTGIGINGIKKRGQEVKVFVRYKKSGGVRGAGFGHRTVQRGLAKQINLHAFVINRIGIQW